MSLFWLSFFTIGFVVASLAYLVARRLGLMSVVDTVWTAGLGVSAIIYHNWMGFESVRSWVVLFVIIFWSFRLSVHLFKDRILCGAEDPRYQALAAHWGQAAPRKFYFLFLAQIVFISLFLIPVSGAMAHSGPFGAWPDFLAILIAIIAMSGESIADKQLADFRRKPENNGGVCQEGFWRYCRHPNYFFEWLHWFVYVAFAFGALQSWIGPLAMYLFLRFITGVPYAERSSLKTRGSAYASYQATTNAFFPWIPRKQSV